MCKAIYFGGVSLEVGVFFQGVELASFSNRRRLILIILLTNGNVLPHRFCWFDYVENAVPSDADSISNFFGGNPYIAHGAQIAPPPFIFYYCFFLFL